MADGTLLGLAALGDLAAILPGTALADASGGIRPDPDARPRRAPQEPLRREPEPQRRPRRDWGPDLISVEASCRSAGLEAGATPGERRPFGPGVIRIGNGSAFRIEVFFHVDAVEVPRPLPFRPPQVGIQHYFTPDGGSRGDTTVLWDPAPVYVAPGHPLRPGFATTIGFATPLGGWLNFSARITDSLADVELDQAVRVEVTA